MTEETKAASKATFGPWEKSSYTGVRFRKSTVRKNGVQADKYFSIRFKVNGVLHEEGVGWASAGMNAEKAYKLLAELKENVRSGTGPKSLAEKRAIANAAQEKKELEARREALTSTTFAAFLESDYWPEANATQSRAWVANEKGVFKNWLQDPLGDIPIKDISRDMVEAVARNMLKAGRAVQTVKHTLKVVQQAWNLAKLRGLVVGESPTKGIKLPKLDNRRIRFLTQDEARALLDDLAKRSPLMHDYAVLALFAGLRAGEIHKLCWSDVNFVGGTISIRDPKNGKTRYALITPEIKAVLDRRAAEAITSELIFPTANGTQRAEATTAFENTVKDLGFNAGITDRRQKVVFHTLRHTFASWLVQRGVPLYTVAQLMGHNSLEMTKRYSHLAPDNMRAAAMLLSGVLEK